MSKEVKSFEEALEVLKTLRVTGVAFFARDHCRVAYYDEMQNLLSIH